MTSITDTRAESLTIGRISRATGINIETIRYYERIGLVPRPPRSRGGHRAYDRAHAQRLRFVRRARELGFGLDNIRTLLTLAGGGSASCKTARGLAAAHLDSVRVKLFDLKKLERMLADTVAQCDAQCCTQPAPPCPVLETLAE